MKTDDNISDHARRNKAFVIRPTLGLPSTAALSNSRGTRGFWGCLLGIVKAWLENTHMELPNTSVPSVDGFRERRPQHFGVTAVNHR